jgi:Tfp pilus assembly protein PilF
VIQRQSSTRAKAAAHFARGAALLEKRRFSEAADAFRAALEGDDQMAEAHVNLGFIAHEAGEVDAAVASYRRAVILRPKLADARFNLGNVLNAAGRLDEAAEEYEQLLSFRPDHGAARINLSVVRLKQNRPKDAEQLVREVLALNPDCIEAQINLGNILMFQHRLAESVAATGRALTMAPGHPQAHVNLGYARFMAGELRAGWPEYEYRWAFARGATQRAPRPNPWLGKEPLDGRSILLHADAGMGDAIQFSRYAPLVAARGAHVHLELPAVLAPLYAGRPFLSGLHTREEAIDSIGLHCPLMSLPLVFDTALETIPPPLEVVASDAAQSRWRSILGPKTRRRIGAVWAGNPGHRADYHRSMSFAVFRTLIDGAPDVEFCSLQNRIRDADAAAVAASRLRNLSKHDIGDFDDMAGAVAAMDLVITVDTAICHLAASMGKPVWLLLSYFPDWRWMLGREDTPWYPTMRLFRQMRPGDWTDVLRRVGAELGKGS